jgi:hypothetical protein
MPQKQGNQGRGGRSVSSVGGESASSSSDRGLAKRVCKQLAEDIERSGGIHRFDKGVKQGLNVLLEAGDSECYGKRGSPLRRQIAQKVARWKTLSPAKYASVLFKLGVTPADARRKGEIEKLVKYPKKRAPKTVVFHEDKDEKAAPAIPYERTSSIFIQKQILNGFADVNVPQRYRKIDPERTPENKMPHIKSESAMKGTCIRQPCMYVASSSHHSSVSCYA